MDAVGLAVPDRLHPHRHELLAPRDRRLDQARVAGLPPVDPVVGSHALNGTPEATSYVNSCVQVSNTRSDYDLGVAVGRPPPQEISAGSD